MFPAVRDVQIINEELKKFNPDLAARPMLVAGNKCDLTDDAHIEEFRKFVEGQGYLFFPIMAPIREGVEPLLNQISEELSKLPPIRRYEPEPAPLAKPEEIPRGEVKITRQDGVFMVEAPWLLRVMQSVNFDDYESLQYFQRVLLETGVIDQLRKAGIQEGDTVSIYDVQFDFVE